MAKKIRINAYDDNLTNTDYNFISKLNNSILNFQNNKRLNKKNLKIIIAIIITLIGIYFLFFYGPSIEKVKKSVVMIEVYDSSGKIIGTGSGFCAFKNDLIVTNFHVIKGAYEIKVITNDKEIYNATKIAVFDYQHDLAILQTNANLSPLKFGYDYEIKTGKNIKTIGSPLGELNTMSTGIISNADNNSGIQISASISHGSSGGVLLDSNNRVIGITYAGYDSKENLNFAINAKILKHIYKMYKNGKYHNISSDGDGDSIKYTLCYPLTHGNLEFQGCGFFDTKNTKDYDLYSTSSIKVLYEITDPFLIYNYIETEKTINSDLYNSLTYFEQKFASELYLEIDDNASIFNDDLNDMNIIDLIYAISKAENNKFSKSNLANAIASIKEIENNTKCFNKVNDMSLSILEKRLLLLGICPSFSPSDLSVADAKGFITNINNLNLSITDKSTILKRFGYRINNGNVNW